MVNEELISTGQMEKSSQRTHGSEAKSREGVKAAVRTGIRPSPTRFQGHDCNALKVGNLPPMSSVGRARERGETQGFMKVVVDAETRKILGVGILGIGGDEVVHAFLDVMYAEAPYTVITRAMHIHPTVADFMPPLLGNLEPLK